MTVVELLRKPSAPIIPAPIDRAGMALWYDFMNTPADTQFVPDLTGNGATLQLGMTSGADANDPLIDNGLDFSVNDIAYVDKSKTGAACSLGSPVFELVIRYDLTNSLRTAFTLGNNVDDGSLHGGMQLEDANQRLAFYARRGGDGATLLASFSYGSLPPVGTWVYLAYHAGARQAAFRWSNGGGLNGAVAGNFGVKTTAVPLIFGAYGLSPGARAFDGAFRHFAIYNGGQRFGTGAAFNTAATDQYNVFAAMGYLS